MIDGTKYTGETRDRLGRTRFRSEGHADHESAAFAVFVARPKAKTATTFHGAGFDIRSHNRYYTVRNAAKRSGVDSLPEALRDEARAYLKG